MSSFKMSLLVLLVFTIPAFLSCKKTGTNKNIEPPGAVEIRDSVIAANLNFPWEILWGPDNHIWMTERGGKISRLNPSTGAIIPLLTISEVQSIGEGGMLGMALHPDFANTPQLFVVYNYDSGAGYREKLVRYEYNGTALHSPVTIIDNIAAANIHNGSRLLIMGDKLFITTGDASSPSLAQNTASPNGKILRLNLDGSVPADNPVAGNPYWSRDIAIHRVWFLPTINYIVLNMDLIMMMKSISLKKEETMDGQMCRVFVMARMNKIIAALTILQSL